MAVICWEWPRSSCSLSPVWPEIDAISVGCNFRNHWHNPFGMHYLNIPHQNQAVVSRWGKSENIMAVFIIHKFTQRSQKHRVNLCLGKELFPVGTSLREKSYKKNICPPAFHFNSASDPQLSALPAPKTNRQDEQIEKRGKMRNAELSRLHFPTSKAIWREFSGLCPRVRTYVQSGRDSEEGVITGGDQAWSSRHLSMHADTYLVLLQITVWPLMQTCSTVPVRGEPPGHNTEWRAGANPPYTVWVCAHVCRLY